MKRPSAHGKKQNLTANHLHLQAQVNTLLHQGFALHQQAKFDEAKGFYERVLSLQPKHFDALQLLGTLSSQTQQYEQAIAFLTRAIAINANESFCHSNLGNAFKSLGRFDDALKSYNQAIALKADNVEAYNNRGSVLQEMQRLDEALLSLNQAIAIKPDYAEAFYNRGNVLKAQAKLAVALESYVQAIAIRPSYMEVYINQGFALHELGRLEAALASFDEAIKLNPNSAKAFAGRGLALQGLLRMNEAVSSFQQAIALDAGFVTARWNLAIAQLLNGDLNHGWQGYELRWVEPEVRKAIQPRSFNEPLWLGESSLQGKTILLYAEQGFGDTLQFCRYVALVADLGAQVILQVQRPLLSLLQSLQGVSQLLAQGDVLPAFDVQCPLMSLPLAFKTHLGSIPSASRYIMPEPAKVAAWQQRLGARTKPRVGLVWSGNVAHANDQNRSLTLSQLLPYLPAHCDYVSLQKEVRVHDQAVLNGHAEFKHFGTDLRDFTDTAALCELMDMVVSVDTSVAHLASAMGKPTKILLPYCPDWRWMLGRTDSPWYPSVQLYRQTQFGDWHEVLTQLKADLFDLA